ncbi:LuxR C-terminal-related transcriptional regulator [Steroidobacter agaridevorans]|uniref:LuxR C-terminal-related transcriptional regulator n=1 Tax=Steroidobacter agaridevorans TaxID=2695856 RepID=UPI00192A67F9|nr:LuxR C-terminal-related transcriptional regulator [Steroidobacter agaridevorans]
MAHQLTRHGKDRAEPVAPRPASHSVSDLGPHYLIHSKLKPPQCATTCIERGTLLARIDAATGQKLTLLAAPVGSGKTTLLAQWHRHSCASHSVAWLSLDEQDNEPVRFFSYLIAAVRSVCPAFDAYLPHRRGADESLDAAIAVFIASLGRLNPPICIVVDDLQMLSTPVLVRAVDALLLQSPAGIRWILSGRGLPPLHMGQLQLNDQLMTLGSEDLNFDTDAIVQLGAQLCHRSLTEDEAQSIRRSTEGWVAGVKLALLAAAGSRDGIGDFNGSHYEVARYLGTSVLQEQEPQLREFLIASSVVDRMTAELCNALLGIAHSQSLLEQLERSQLFIQPLDSHGHWYRYHTLFLDFLRSHLRHDTAQLSILNERASRWYAEHQLYAEALHHAFAASNEEWRLELLERCATTWLRAGETVAVIHWITKVPHNVILGHAGICRSYIASLILSRRFNEAAATLREVEANVSTERALGSVHLRLLHAMLTVLADSSGQIGISSPEALRDRGADSFLIGTLLTLQAYTMLRLNQFDKAWRLAMRARDTFDSISLYSLGYAEVVASLADRAQGDMKAAADRCERMFQMVRGGHRTPAWVNAANALAYMRYEENRLDEAEALCTEVLPLLSVQSTVENVVTAYVTLSRIKASNGRYGEAFQLLDYLHSMLESGSHARFLAQVCAEKLRLLLSQDNLQRARAVALEFGLQRRARSGEWRRSRSYDETWERFGSGYAALLIKQRQYDEARALLLVLRDSAHEVGYVYREAPLEAVLACCYWHSGDIESAFDCLNRGFALTRGHGFTRGVFDEAPSMIQVIAAALTSGRLCTPLPTHYFCKFENVFSQAVPVVTPSPRKSALPLEPLTEREVDMLRLLALGLSNHEISARSQIALSTAKWHLKNVFAKLDVSTRTGAIARAREMRLIE